MAFGARKNEQGEWVFSGGKYANQPFDKVASENPSYVQFVQKATRQNAYLPDDAYYAIEDVMRKRRIDFL
jgi:hypothetical protein